MSRPVTRCTSPRRRMSPRCSSRSRGSPETRIDIIRDALGTPVEVRHSGGYRVAVDTTDGLVTALRLLPGTDQGDEPVLLHEFRYDANRRLTESVNSSQQALRFDYDEDGRIVRWEDRNGMWYRYTYDADGRCVLAEGRAGYLTYRFEYDRDNLVTRANQLARSHHDIPAQRPAPSRHRNRSAGRRDTVAVGHATPATQPYRSARPSHAVRVRRARQRHPRRSARWRPPADRVRRARVACSSPSSTAGNGGGVRRGRRPDP